MNAVLPQDTCHLLLVDDEPNILMALRRAFRSESYTIHCATNGVEGLAVMAAQPIDLVISDMRMPSMDGAAFLEQVARRFPDCIRLLLTGHSDLASTVSAINKGMIYRYIAKPWDTADLLLTVRQALQVKQLELQAKHLQKLTQKQNAQLRDLNLHLEEKVAARTAEIEKASQLLEGAYREVNQAYENTIRVFSSLIDMKESLCKGHARRVAELSRDVAMQLQLTEKEVNDVYFAGLLHELGKLSLPDSLLAKPSTDLSRSARDKYRKHPLIGQEALTAVEALQGAGVLIRSHEECWDGSGFPDRLRGVAIPLGARILAVAKDFFAYQFASYNRSSVTANEAFGRIKRGAGKQYDPDLIAVFGEVLQRGSNPVPADDVRCLGSEKLKSGMILARDLYNKNELLLLTKGRQLTDQLIQRLRQVEKLEESRFQIYVNSSISPAEAC